MQSYALIQSSRWSEPSLFGEGDGTPNSLASEGELTDGECITRKSAALAWIERLLPTGVLPWQRRFVVGALASREAALSIARGGGKTALASALAAHHLTARLHAGEVAEVILVAASHSQARIAFSDILRMLDRAGVLNRADRARWSISDTVNHARLEHRPSGSLVRCVGSDPRLMHGLRPSLVLCDEPAQWGQYRSDRAIAALRTGVGKRPGSALWAIGTMPDAADHWFSRLIREPADGRYSQLHAARPGDPPHQRRTWMRANPSLAAMPELLAAYESESDAARRDPALLASFRSLRLNMGTSDVIESHLVDPDVWESCEGDAERLGAPVWGVDLGTSAAMSAIAAFWPHSGRLEVLGAFPTEPSLRERGLADGVGGLYVDMESRGELICCGGRASDVSALVAEAHHRFGAPVAVVSDRWREAELRDVLAASSIPPVSLVLRGQGFRDGGQDLETFRRACADGSVCAQSSLLLRSAISEARAVSDPAGNSKLAKSSEGGRRRLSRDDAAAAAILAVAEGVRGRKTLAQPEMRAVIV